MVLVNEAARIYKNSDGVRLRFGTDQAAAAREGSPRQAGVTKVLEFDLMASDMGAFGLNQFLNKVPTVVLPAGNLLVSAILRVIVPFDSLADALTLDLGTANQDGTVVNATGLTAATAQAAIDAAGETVTCAGALINTILASDQYITVRANVATATVGKAKLHVTLLPVGDL
jgi:hypothetical protein